MAVSLTESSPIPLIDLSVTRSVAELSAEVLHAASTIGFLFIKLPQDGGLRQEKVNEMFAISQKFFDSPLDDRLACGLDKDTNGYIGFRKNRLAESKGAGDMKENITYGRHPVELDATRQHLSPVLAAHQVELDAFHGACWDLTCQLLDAFSVALKLPSTFFRERHRQGANGLSLNNYPAAAPGEIEIDAAAARASAHKDWGSLTLLFQEEFGTPGLEVFLPHALVAASKSSQAIELMADVDLTQGEWHAAPVIPGTVLVNLGLAIEGWTSGVLRATLHRVIGNAQAEGGFKQRKSIPYFVQPSETVVFNPIKPDGSIEQVEGALTSWEFFDQRQQAALAAIESVAVAA